MRRRHVSDTEMSASAPDSEWTSRVRRPSYCAAAVVLLTVVLTGCSTLPAATVAPPAAAPPAAAPSAATGEPGNGHSGGGAPVLYAVQSGPLGVVVTDGDGRLLYRSDADGTAPPTSRCTDTCTTTWEPFTTAPGMEPQALGVDPDLVSTLTRPDGSLQVTLSGWPLYRDPADQGVLADTGRHGEDGQWFVVTPAGEHATASP